ncbi:MAG: ISKra4 family transposase [Terriglobales bacterium]
MKLVAEVVPGKLVEHEIAAIERPDEILPASVGLTIAEGKAILERVQKAIVAAQVEQHGVSIRSCPRCGNAFRTKGYYRATLRSVYGNVGMRIRRLRGCSCSGTQARSFSSLFTNKNPTTPELRYLTAKMAALLPFGKVADFLGELLPLSSQTTASTVRNRTMKVGRRLQKSAEVLASSASKEPARELVVGLDGGYVRNRHQRPERNFEVVAGKALDGEGNATRFAFVRNGGSEAMSAVDLAMRQCGVTEITSITVLTDGDAGLRAVQRQVAPEAEHVLDWFHIAMRFTNLQQVAKGVNALTDGGVRSHALKELDRAKWRFWNGHRIRGLVGLVDLQQWAGAQCFDHISCLKKLENVLSEMVRYLELNADSMPNYGKRYRAGQRISTGFVESAVNEIVSKRMVKKQQMRWNRHTVQSFLDVRVHVLNGTLENAFRHWHQGFRPIAEPLQVAAAA